MNKHKPSLSLITSNFNAISLSWWSNDISTTEELKLYSQTSTNRFDQLINGPTHVQTKIQKSLPVFI